MVRIRIVDPQVETHRFKRGHDSINEEKHLAPYSSFLSVFSVESQRLNLKIKFINFFGPPAIFYNICCP